MEKETLKRNAKGSEMRKLILWVCVLLMIGFGGFFILSSRLIEGISGIDGPTGESSILHLKLNQPIFDLEDFLSDLRKYRKNDKVKAVFIEINSPGGAVGPSQELYYELRATKEKYKKPVVVFSTSVLASGALYAAVGAEKIYTHPSTLVGSIGVIMRFVNLEDLYSWAKVKHNVLKTGKFKDSGADFREMTEDEKIYFQNLLQENLDQFVQAIAEGRGLEYDVVKKYADGKVFTGAYATTVGLTDGTILYEDAVEATAKLVGLKEGDYKLWEPPVEQTFVEYLGLNSLAVLEQVEGLLPEGRAFGQPLFIMPGVL